MAFDDAKHRAHAVHTGESPVTRVDVGPDALSVTLDTWGPLNMLFTTMCDQLMSNWGELPLRTAEQPEGDVDYGDARVPAGMQRETGWTRLTAEQKDYVQSCFEGRTLPQVKEMITFGFTIDGVCRAATHQLVRARIGAGFMQHGGRDNDWRHRAWTMPETMRRACVAMERVIEAEDAEDEDDVRNALGTTIDDIDEDGREQTLTHCLTNPEPLARLVNDWNDLGLLHEHARTALEGAIVGHVQAGKVLYAALVDAGIPWQDARRVLTIGSQTYLHADYNYLALEGVLANRLEFIMDWEINCVSQLMMRELRMKTPRMLWSNLGSRSDKAKRAQFAGLDSWPPDGKWPLPDGTQLRPSFHRPEQMPFFVLHPDSMDGGPIKWIRTNGTYPHDHPALR